MALRLLLERLQRGVEHPVAAVAAIVGRDPLLDGVDAGLDADTACDRLLGVGEEAGADAREQRRAERRALLRLGGLERETEHRGHDPQPEGAPRPSARDAADFGAHPELA